MDIIPALSEVVLYALMTPCAQLCQQSSLATWTSDVNGSMLDSAEKL